MFTRPSILRAAFALALASASLLPSALAYRVDGTIIRDPSGAEFVVKGVNIGGYRWHFYRDSVPDAALIKDTWNFNTVRVANGLGPNIYGIAAFRDSKTYLYNLVSTFRAQGTVVILDVHDLMGSYTSSTTNPTRAQTKAFFVDLANRYKGDLGVWFNIRNEPGDNSFNWGEVHPEWLAEAEDLINTVRGTGARNIILVGESAWGQGANSWTDTTVTDWSSGVMKWGTRLATTQYGGFAGNVAFDWHIYDQWNDSANKLGQYITDARAKNLCLVVGEYGSDNGPGNHTIAATRRLRDVGFPRKLGAIAWSWGCAGDSNDLTKWDSDPYDQSGAGWMIKFGADGKPNNLTEFGQIVWDFTHAGTPPPPPSGPDLVVTAITASANNRYTLTIKNQGGSANTSAWIGVQLFRNGSYADWGGKVVSLAPNATTTITTESGTTPTGGTWTARGLVDYTNTVTESNETNNDFTRTFP